MVTAKQEAIKELEKAILDRFRDTDKFLNSDTELSEVAGIGIPLIDLFYYSKYKLEHEDEKMYMYLYILSNLLLEDKDNLKNITFMRKRNSKFIVLANLVRQFITNHFTLKKYIRYYIESLTKLQYIGIGLDLTLFDKYPFYQSHFNTINLNTIYLLREYLPECTWKDISKVLEIDETKVKEFYIEKANYNEDKYDTIIVCGPNRSGKTRYIKDNFLSKELVDYISIDELKDEFIKSTAPNLKYNKEILYRSLEFNLTENFRKKLKESKENMIIEIAGITETSRNKVYKIVREELPDHNIALFVAINSYNPRGIIENNTQLLFELPHIYELSKYNYWEIIGGN